MRHSTAGFSLVGIMVGMAVGMLAMMVIYQMLSVSEGYKRTTTGGVDAQLNGALSLLAVERDIRQAGFGINQSGLLGCTVRAHDETPPGEDFSFVFAPVVITQGVGNAPDTMTVTYSNASCMNVPVSLIQDMPSPTAVYKVNNRYCFREGDLVIAAEPGKDCTLAQVTELPGAPGQSDNLIHNSGNYTDANGNQVRSRYNKPAGLGVSYTTAGRIYNLGPQPGNQVYSVENNSLQVQSGISAVSSLVANGIIDLQAQYGIDTNSDGAVDSFQTSADLDADGTVSDTEWGRVLSIRFGLLARSNKIERSCDVTTAVPTWSGGSFNAVSNDPNWRCYRYRVFQTTAMIRNMIWRPQ